MPFFISTQRYVKGYQKSCPWEKNTKQLCQIALFSSKTATESLKSYTVFCFDLQTCFNHFLSTLTETRLKPKRPKVKEKQKVIQNSLEDIVSCL